MLIVRPYHTNAQLASIASYFWEKMAQHFKDEWKRVPQEGEKKKKTGFWLFALSLEKVLLTRDAHFFTTYGVLFTISIEIYGIPSSGQKTLDVVGIIVK
uniref:Uncharacterized protein n=1 Tax=Romanomermis culicivorax TaxID=13658 RepID=A0A915JXM4_ROMCU